MARGGFIGRIARAIRNIVAPPARHAPPVPPPRERPQPAEQRPVPSAPARGPGADEYRQVWKDNKIGRRGDYRKNLRVFHNVVDPIESDPEERLFLWESYVQNIVSPRGRARRQSTENLFWRDSGIDPADFNWQKWREAMGYTGKRRSRTP